MELLWTICYDEFYGVGENLFFSKSEELISFFFYLGYFLRNRRRNILDIVYIYSN